MRRLASNPSAGEHPESACRASARPLSLDPLPPDARTPLVADGEPSYVVVAAVQVCEIRRRLPRRPLRVRACSHNLCSRQSRWRTASDSRFSPGLGIRPHARRSPDASKGAVLLLTTSFRALALRARCAASVCAQHRRQRSSQVPRELVRARCLTGLSRRITCQVLVFFSTCPRLLRASRSLRRGVRAR